MGLRRLLAVLVTIASNDNGGDDDTVDWLLPIERCWSWDCGVKDDTTGIMDCTRHIVRITVDGSCIIELFSPVILG